MRTFGAIRKSDTANTPPWLSCLPITPPGVWLVETAEANLLRSKLATDDRLIPPSTAPGKILVYR